MYLGIDLNVSKMRQKCQCYSIFWSRARIKVLPPRSRKVTDVFFKSPPPPLSGLKIEYSGSTRNSTDAAVACGFRAVRVHGRAAAQIFSGTFGNMSESVLGPKEVKNGWADLDGGGRDRRAATPER